MVTRENVERRQARSVAEIEQEDEQEAADMAVDESDSDDEDRSEFYNPKDIPLGWDGKPIPYWLYKLHGLNVRYSCEICGNYVYRGPKAYQQHFKEWRHAHGMRCLGIPNTVHFQNVTLINDAKALWDKLKSQKTTEAFQEGEEEEYEDSLGNVVNKKTYEDLRRQGLL
jgi:splicing factor 3A subunit 3